MPTFTSAERTIETLVEALEILLSKPLKTLRLITPWRKMHESLLSSEELAKSIEQEDYITVPPDTRSLNYDAYFNDAIPGETGESYSSLNATKLNAEQLADKIVRAGLMDDPTL